MHVYQWPDTSSPESNGCETDGPDTHKGCHYMLATRRGQHVVTSLVGVRLLLLLLFVMLLAGCGSNTTNSTASASSSPSASSTLCTRGQPGQARGQAAIGTLTNINGSTLQISTVQGASVSVMYTSSTRFTRQTSIAATALQEGEAVTVVVSQNAGNTYTATRIMVVNTSSGSQAFPFSGQRKNSLCPRRTPTGGFGSFGNGGNPNGGTNGARALIGTVGQMNGSALTITDRTGTNYTVTVTAQTQISQTTSVTASALKTGMALTVTGTKNNQGGITARAIVILQSLPSRIPTVQTS
jgi:hypothetical protein